MDTALGISVPFTFGDLGEMKNSIVSVPDPSHEIMVLFVLCKLINQTRNRARCLIFGRTLCLLRLQTAKALARLRGCEGLPEPLLVAYFDLALLFIKLVSRKQMGYICR